MRALVILGLYTWDLLSIWWVSVGPIVRGVLERSS
jgi:hypothetical protein